MKVQGIKLELEFQWGYKWSKRKREKKNKNFLSTFYNNHSMREKEKDRKKILQQQPRNEGAKIKRI